MSAAPSISTPRLPPSLTTFFNFFFCSSLNSRFTCSSGAEAKQAGTAISSASTSFSAEGKSSSPKTNSSSESSLSSGKSPLLRKKLFASKIIASRIFNGKIPLSPSTFTTPWQTDLPSATTCPPKRFSTVCNHSLHSSSPCFS